MSSPTHYILSLDLQLKWIDAVRTYSQEWVAGLKLDGECIKLFGFRLGSESEVEFINIEDVSNAIGTVHYHPYEHSVTPIPSISDGVNWVYLSYWQIPDNLNPIFFIVFRDYYASWAMFPKPPTIRKIWIEEYENLKDNPDWEEDVSINTCLRLLGENTIKTGVFRLGEEDKKFQTF